MNTMPTVRRGRRYEKAGDNDARGLRGFCSVLLILALITLPPAVLYISERTRYVRYLTLSEALDGDIIELNNQPSISSLSAVLQQSSVSGGTLVHGTSSHIDAQPTDGEMSVSIPGALVLRRNCEYCQWQEVQSQRCNTCTRTVTAKDGSSKEESYQCDCVQEYNYIKSWRSYRINSLLFNQPGAHHNPQRDPMPSRTFVDEETMLSFSSSRNGIHDGAFVSVVGMDDEEDTMLDSSRDSNNFRASLDPAMLSSGVRGWPYRYVEFTRDGVPPPPSFFSRFFSYFTGQANARYEPLRLLQDTSHSVAAMEHNFVYVGQGGYFFSPYESSTASMLFNYFAQYLEGSLFDWQVGDLMPSCTAGDVRFRYEVQDPAVVSVLGQIDNNNANGVLSMPWITPRTMEGISNAGEDAARIGLVHAGGRSSSQMLIDEDSDSRNRANIFRGILFVWSIPFSRLAGVALRREMGESSTIVQIEGTLGLFLTVLGAMWLVIWRHQSSYGTVETSIVFLVGGVFYTVAYQSAYRIGGGRRWRAVWCRVLRWANTPPEWRVEDTHIGGFSRLDGGDGGTSKKL